MAARPKRVRGRPPNITDEQIALIQLATETIDKVPPNKERTVRRVCLHLCDGDIAKARALQMAYTRARRSAVDKTMKSAAALRAAWPKRGR